MLHSYPYIRHATLLDVLSHFHTYVMPRCWMFSCTSTHTSCDAAGCSLALPHMRHATLLECSLALPHIRHATLLDASLALPHIYHTTLLDAPLHFHTYVMLRCWMNSCTSTHTSCYAAGCSLVLYVMLHCFHLHTRHATLLDVLLHFHTYVMLRCWMPLLHFHTYAHATLLDVLLHFHTYVMLRCWMFSCASTHTSCYAAGCSLALPHIRHATLLDVLLHFHTYVSCYAAGCSLRTSTHTSCYAAG